MELKRVEMVGFKSFPERLRVEFDRGVTAIVGPNGSGKSNIADAVRWVLGEQSAKTLRGGKMEDVIFAGTERRKPLGYAEVILVLENQDKKIPVDYEEVMIGRRMYRSGESEYTINGARCRLRDVQELLMDTGIGKDGYSLIGQGQIDQLLSSKPQDRRALFEEAAGITKYRTRKEQAEKQLQDEHERLARVGDILTEIESRLEPLSKQAEVTRAYQKLREELKLYEVSAFIGEYEILEAQAEKAKQALAELKDQMVTSQAEREAAKRRSEELARTADADRRALMELTEQRGELKVALESAEGEKRLMEQSLSHREEEIEASKKRQEELLERAEDRKKTILLQEEKTKALSETVEQREKEAEEAREAREEKEAAQQSLAELMTKLQKEAVKLREEAASARTDLSKKELLVQQDEEGLQNFASEKERLESGLSESREGLARLGESCEKAGNTVLEAKKASEEAGAKIKRAAEAHLQQEKRQAEAELRLKDAQGRLKWLSGLQQDYEGYSGAVKALMKLKESAGRGAAILARAGYAPDTAGAKIKGTLADLIAVPEKLAAAVDTALGAGIQSVVVEDTDEAKRLIEHLREKKLGRATFLPLDSVKARSPHADADKIRAMKGVLGFADELVKADPLYRAILSRQLGGTVITEDFDSGRQVAQKYSATLRVVTLSGDSFNVGGSITGGSRNSQKNGLLSRRTELETLKSEVAALQEEVLACRRSLSDAIRMQNDAEKEAKEAADTLREAENILRNAENEVEKQKFLERQFEEALKNLEMGKESALRDGESHEAAQEAAKKYYEAALERLKAHEEKIAKLESDSDEGRSALREAMELQSRAQVALASARQERQYMTQAIEWEKKEIDSVLAELETEKKTEEDLRETLSRETAGMAGHDESLERMVQKIERMDEAIRAKEAEYQEKDQEREKAIEEAEETLRSYAALEKEEVRLENQKSRSEKELNDLLERMWEDYEITYAEAKTLSEKGFSDDEKLKEAAELSKTRRRQEISRIRGMIKELGPVNPGAIEEYRELRERYDFLAQQRDDILLSEKDLTEVIRQMTERMAAQFKESFQAVADSFNRVFRQMFGGGQGQLRLMEGEDALEAGIEIIAQPPGKKLQSMLLLSGGERALTAIALLFAIQELNPSPFCILDEIEAALDDVNVDRYADYLRAMSDETQFIVITHRKGTMAAAHTLYGVTMEEKGVSKCVSVRFEETA